MEVRAGLRAIEAALTDVGPAMNAVSDAGYRVMGNHYGASGLRIITGRLFNAVVGNFGLGYREIMGNTVRQGVDVRMVSYARLAFGGRRGFGPIRAKALRFYDPNTNTVVFRKRVGPAPARPVYYLLPDDVAQLQGAAIRSIAERAPVKAV